MAIKRNGALVTVAQHIMEQQRQHPTASGEFSWLLSGVTLAAKMIAANVRRAGLMDIIGTTGDTNVQGEVVQKLDIIANDTLKRTLGYRNVGIIASEEDDEPRVLADPEEGGNYIVMFDPLDGSSNIDANVPVGTIFTIMSRVPGEKHVDQSVLQPGHKQLAAGYIVYGSSTVLVYSTGQGVHMFTLDPSCGAFLLTQENIQIPLHTAQYSVNEAYMHSFDDAYTQYLDWAKDQKQGGGCSMRYIGSLVADFHRILIKGGIFLYPPTEKNPQGKLRLMYEANPLAFIAQQAGGLATNGADPILDIVPTSLHQRTALIIGGKGNVEDAMRFISKKPLTK